MPISGLIAATLAGLLGGAHCLAMCDGFYVVANVFLLALAFAIVSKGNGIPALQRLGSALFAMVLPVVRPLRARHDATARFALGAIWGLVPCGLVYGVLPIALFAGGAWQGALVMLAFGIGTLPNLLAAGWIVARARSGFDSRVARFAAASLLAGFALAGRGRAIFGSVAAMQGAFCF